MYRTTTEASPARQQPAGPGAYVPVPPLHYPLTSFRLPNGLRVVLLPDQSLSVVEVTVLYGVGSRSEPRGRAGFAHLFEHLMFQGVGSPALSSYTHRVQGAGGTMNAYTRPDHTYYHQTVPSAALEVSLQLESDRMLRPLFTEEDLRTQVAVVSEEIRGQVLNRPYGEFPWRKLCAELFDSYPNTHDGYGSFRELASATPDQAEEFFTHHYAPGNAVLCLVGGFDPDRAEALVRRCFGAVAARPVPSRPDTSEPQLTEVRRSRYIDPLAPVPAFAVGWRVPRWRDDGHHLSHLVLREILVGGIDARLPRRLTDREEIAFGLGAQVGFRGDTLGCRPPSALVVTGHPREVGDVDRIHDALGEELAELAANGPDAHELRRATARVVSALLREADRTVNRAVLYGAAHLHGGDASAVNSYGGLICALAPGDLARTAAELAGAGRALVTLATEGERR